MTLNSIIKKIELQDTIKGNLTSLCGYFFQSMYGYCFNISFSLKSLWNTAAGHGINIYLASHCELRVAGT